MYKNHNNKKFTIGLLLLILLAIGIGYAYLTSNLSISGNTSVLTNTWNIHFDNLNVLDGSVTATIPASIESNETSVSFSINLNRPKEFYEFTVDVVNEGTLPGKVFISSISGITEEMSSIIDYQVTYLSGESINNNDILRPGRSKRVKVSIRYKDDINPGDFPDNGDSLNLTYTLNYIQSEKDYDVNQINCTFEGNLTQGAEYINGDYTYHYKQMGSAEVNQNTGEVTAYTWTNIDNDGWGVILTDKTSTAPITSNLCSTINNKPIVAMSTMFLASKSTSIDLSTFDTSNVVTMEDMFAASSFTSLDVSNFDTHNVENMSGMFAQSKLTAIDISGFDFSNATDISLLFYQSSDLEIIDFTGIEIPVAENIGGMFAFLPITELDVCSLDTSSVQTMEQTFAGYTNMKSIDISCLNTGNVTSMMGLFYRSSSLENITLGNIDTTKVENMSYMFLNTSIKNIDLSGLETGAVKDMRYMFQSTYSLEEIDLSTFDLTSLTQSAYMFNGSHATIGYAKNQTDANKFNSTTGKPSTLTFVVKP